MRVLFLNSRLSDKGGADRWLLDLVAALQGRVQTLVLYTRYDSSIPEYELKRIGPVKRVKGLDRGGIGRPAGKSSLEAIERAIEKFNPQVIHTNDVLDSSVLNLVASTVKTVITVQDHRFFCPGPGKVLPDATLCRRQMGPSCAECISNESYLEAMLNLTRARLSAVKGAAAVVVLSGYMASELASAGIDRNKIFVVPPVVRPPSRAQSGLGEAKRHHLLACRLVRYKGVLTALEAARMLTGGAKLLVAGKGPLEKLVEEAASTVGSNVEYLGWLDRNKYWKILDRVVSVWMPSVWAEPFGIAGLEASMAGVPVLAPARAGITDWFVPGETGLEVQPADPCDLASKAEMIAQRMTDVNSIAVLHERLGVNRFRKQEILTRLLHLYRSISN